jgi:prophage regulatory protein
MNLIPKRAVLKRVGLSYPTVWRMMRDGKFPRSRVAGGQSMWFESEIDAWLADLPLRELKGDAPANARLKGSA